MNLWNHLSLGHLRLIVQIAMFGLLVYGGTLAGHYAADKISGELPALSCAYDKLDAAYCVLIPTQHQLHHRVGEALVTMQQFSFKVILPLLFTFLTFYAFFVLLNKMFCGWICPLGTFQEMLYRLGRGINLQNRYAIHPTQLSIVRPIKWLILIGLVFVLPLLAGLGVTSGATGDSFCQICPSRVLTTLATGDFEQLTINQASLGDWIFSAIRAALFGIIVVTALTLRQPFCRICPLLAFNSLFQRLSPMRLVKQPHDKCTKCGICHKACPMDIQEIWHESGHKAFHEDCTLCGRCAEFCPDDKVIQLKFAWWAWFSSSREYYKRRIKGEKPEGYKVGKKLKAIPIKVEKT